MAVIDIDGLSVRFGAHEAVQELDLTIDEGSFLGLLGPNGAGKTTTISCIAGFTRPSAGSIRVDGFDPIRDPVEVRRRIGLVPQKIALYPTLSVRRNLLVFGGLHKLSRRRLDDRVDWALAVAQLADRADSRVDTLSGGMQRRLNLVASLLHDPPIIICDEPTANVDPNSRKHIFDILRRLHGDGKRTLVYTSHYMEEVEALCSEVAIMAWGKLLVHDELERLLGAGDGHTEFRIVTRAPTSVDALRTSLLEGAVDVQSVAISQRSLEDVFFELTGRPYRSTA